MRTPIALGIAAVLIAACGSDPGPGTTATTSPPTSIRASTTTLPPATVTLARTEGLPDDYPPELVPPGVTSSEWAPTGAGTDVFFEVATGFDEIIDFYTDALEPPLDVRTEDGVDRAIWVYKPGVEHIAVIVESDAGGVHIKVSGLF